MSSPCVFEGGVATSRSVETKGPGAIEEFPSAYTALDAAEIWRVSQTLYADLLTTVASSLYLSRRVVIVEFCIMKEIKRKMKKRVVNQQKY